MKTKYNHSSHCKYLLKLHKIHFGLTDILFVQQEMPQRKQYENTLKHKVKNTKCSLTSPSLKASEFYAQKDKKQNN